jgi:protein-S-isoprenylcysteine O-methyltransferase Ste14
VKRLAQLAAFVVIQGLVLFLASGQPAWFMAWVYLGSYAVLVALNAAVLLPRDPELIAERGRIKENTKGWDRVLMVLLTIFGLVTLAVGGLDHRFRWTPALGWSVPLVGFVLFLLSWGLVSWAMASNRFFSSVVRIQADRGHAVADGGPYRLVRHPGYLAMMVSISGVALMLESLWALIGAGLYAATMVVRTVLEDRMLKVELAGYQDYAARVPYRLVPGLW